MDELTDQTAELSLQSNAAGAAVAASSSALESFSFQLHVLDLSGTSDDAAIELSISVPNYFRLEWRDASAAEELSVLAVKQRIYAHRRSTTRADENAKAVVETSAASASIAANSTSATALAALSSLETSTLQPASAAVDSEPLDLTQMRLVFLTQRVPPVASGTAVSSSSSSSSGVASAQASAVPSASCRPLTDLGSDSKLLCDYGVATHSWLLLKRKFIPNVQPQESHEEEEEEEDWEEDADGGDPHDTAEREDSLNICADLEDEQQ